MSLIAALRTDHKDRPAEVIVSAQKDLKTGVQGPRR